MRWASLICLVWIGIVIGVSFIATPAKFLAVSVTLSDALAIGRVTFSAFFWVELALLIILSTIYLLTLPNSLTNWLGLFLLASILGVNYLVIQPILDVRTEAIINGEFVPPSTLHRYYVGVEFIKLAWLSVMSWRLNN